VFLFQSLFERVNIVVPPHYLIRCRFLCEFSRWRAEVLWRRTCKCLRRLSVFLSHKSSQYFLPRSPRKCHCSLLKCAVSNNFSLSFDLPSPGVSRLRAGCVQRRATERSHPSDGAEGRWVSAQAVREGWSGLQHPPLVFQSIVQNVPQPWYS